MPEKTPVLIIGAGPSGLVMAAALERHNIDYRIIDKHSEPVKTSNAAAIHSRSLEMLDDLEVIDTFIKRGQKINAIQINRDKIKLANIETSHIESHYNFILSIPQNITEEILNHHLNKLNRTIERNKTLSAVKTEEHGVTAEVLDKDGNIERIPCQYLIAADGSHSTTRKLLRMKFSGIDIQQQFIIADTNIPDGYPDDQFSIYFSSQGPLAVFPFQKGKARIIATMIEHKRDPNQPVSLLEIQNIVKKRSGSKLEILSTNWTSSFWIHSKMLNHFKKGPVFFIGDAAHIHSPAGGQGMNTGMQDAYNLAWKIAATINGHAKPNLLESYDDERTPNAHALLSNTERLTKMFLIKNPLLQWLRQRFLKFFMEKETFQHLIINELSMLKIHYEKSPVINYEFHVAPKGPLPGHRAPDVYYTDRNGLKRMDDLLRTPKHTLLIFTGKKPSKHDIADIRKIDQWGIERQELLKTIIIVHPNASNQFSDQDPLDTNKDLHEAYHVSKPSFFMVRPDNYIGCCSAELNLELLNNYWIHIFN